MASNDKESALSVEKDKGSVALEETTRERERYFTPAVDIYENGNGLHVLADLPGVDKDDVSITVENQILTIDAKVHEGTNGQDVTWLWREHRPAHYWRQFRLNHQVDVEGIKGELKNGVLRIFLPKAEEYLPRQIEVQVA